MALAMKLQQGGQLTPQQFQQLQMHQAALIQRQQLARAAAAGQQINPAMLQQNPQLQRLQTPNLQALAMRPQLGNQKTVVAQPGMHRPIAVLFTSI